MKNLIVYERRLYLILNSSQANKIKNPAVFILTEDQSSVIIIKSKNVKHTQRGNSFLKFEKNADPLLAFGFSRPLICPGTIQSHRNRFKSYELRKNDTRQEANRKRYQRGHGDFGAKLPD